MFGVLEHSKVLKYVIISHSKRSIIVDIFLSFSKQYIKCVKVLQYGELRLLFSVNIGKNVQSTELTINKRCSSPNIS